MIKSRFLLTSIVVLFGATFALAQRPPANPLLTELLEQKDTVVLQQKLQALEKGENEDNLSLLLTYYNRVENEEKATEVSKLIDKHFPDGKRAFDAALEEIYNERNPARNEKNYEDFMSRFSKNPAFANHRFFDFAKYYVAITFLGKEKPDKVLEYLNLIQDSTYKTDAFSFTARESIAAKDYKLGESLIKKVFSDVEKKGGDKPRNYYQYSIIAAELFFLNEKYEEGFKYAKDAFNNNPDNIKIKDLYLDYLVVNGQLKEAYPMMEESLREGRASEVVKNQFGKAYIEINGDEEGFAELETSIKESLMSKIKSEVAEKMINEPAYDFTVVNLEGEKISLSDYKGKVVVLDFWATWCAPCKASFPLMQAAVDQYENDPNVVFLFIHTWENTANPVQDAGNYIRDMKYTFNVLMDLKDTESGTNEAAVGYKLRGIPAKFVIDKNGNIRFRSLGGENSGNDAFLLEMEAMIEMARS